MTSSSSARVVALLPAWQAASFIQPTLDSLSAQTHQRFEVIVSVDLCEDATYDLCEAHARRDPRFRVVRQPQRLGYVGNCNFLLDQADADHALFAFHDDLIAPEYISRLSAALDARPGAVVAFSDVLLTHVDGREENWEFTELEGVADPVARGRVMLRGDNKWWVPNRGVFRMAMVRGIDGLRTHGAGEFSADWPWLFHMSLLGEFIRVPQRLCHKFYKPGSLSRGWRYTPRQRFEARAACIREIWNSPLDTAQKLELTLPLAAWLSRRQRSLEAE